jgi:hypothetical protein
MDIGHKSRFQGDGQVAEHFWPFIIALLYIMVAPRASEAEEQTPPTIHRKQYSYQNNRSHSVIYEVGQ